jgi:hypothetical protein
LSYILLNSSIVKTEEAYLKRQSQRLNWP